MKPRLAVLSFCALSLGLAVLLPTETATCIPGYHPATIAFVGGIVLANIQALVFSRLALNTANQREAALLKVNSDALAMNIVTGLAYAQILTAHGAGAVVLRSAAGVPFLPLRYAMWACTCPLLCNLCGNHDTARPPHRASSAVVM
eukprot:4801872-Prymnesium_polylepis.1